VNGFIDHLEIVTISNHSAITNLHTLQITRARAKTSQSAFTSRFQITDLNNGDSSASVLTSLLSDAYLTTEPIAPTVPVITSRYGPHTKHCSSIVALCPLPRERVGNRVFA
jgi:hypothetical protein